MNSQLRKLYDIKFQQLKESHMKSLEFDGPLLMYVWEQEYIKSDYKMLFVGRESNGWLGDLHFGADEAINKYKQFELCENGKYTTFWQYIYETKNILMPNTIGQKNFLWTNVSKFSKLNGTAIDMADFQFFCDNFDIFQGELEILKPDVIIFFTGIKWDEKIQYQIQDEIKFHDVTETISVNELARLSSKYFPKHTYRVDHPITLQTNKNWGYIKHIISNIKTNNIEVIRK